MDKLGPRWVDRVEAATKETIFVLPLGATEQHGPHLPFETDTIIAQGVCDRLIQNLPLEADIRFLPVEAIGYSLEHMDHEGSKTLTYHEAIKQWVGIGADITAHGGRKLVMMNAHGGNSPLMTIVAQELRAQYDMLAVATSWTRFIKQKGAVSPAEEAFGIHGGEIETAVMLALAPDQVDMKKAMDFPNLQETLIQDFEQLRAYGPHAFGWKATDLNRSGVTGNAAAATKPTGEKLLAHAVEGLCALFNDVLRFDCEEKFQSTVTVKNPDGHQWKLRIPAQTVDGFWFWYPKIATLLLLGALFAFYNTIGPFTGPYTVFEILIVSYVAVLLAVLSGMVGVARIWARATTPMRSLFSLIAHALLLIGLFSIIYAEVQFSGMGKGRDGIYFSIVTWTTLGYGDFKPVEHLRLLAAFEAVLGYVYSGLIVGVMVSVIAARKRKT